MTTLAVTGGLREIVYDQDVLDEAMELENIWASVSKYREGHYTKGSKAAGSLATTTTHAESLSNRSSGYSYSTAGSGSPRIMAASLSESVSYDSNDGTIDTFNYLLPRMFLCAAEKGSKASSPARLFLAKHSSDELKQQGGHFRACKAGSSRNEVHHLTPGHIFLSQDSLDDLKEQGGNFMSCKAMPSVDESTDHNALFVSPMQSESGSILSTFDEEEDEETEEMNSNRSSCTENRKEYSNSSKCDESREAASSGELSSAADFLYKDIYQNEIKSFVSTLDDNEEDEDSSATSSRTDFNERDVIGAFKNFQNFLHTKKRHEKEHRGNKFPLLNVNFPLSPSSLLAQPFSPSTIRTVTDASFLEVPVDQFGQEECDKALTKNCTSVTVRNPSCPVRQAKQSAFICSSILCTLTDVYNLHSSKPVEYHEKDDGCVEDITAAGRSVLGNKKLILHDLVEINMNNNCVELILSPNDDAHEPEEIKSTPPLKALLDDSGKKKRATVSSKWKSNELAEVAADLLLNLVDAKSIKSPSHGTLLIQAAQQQADKISLPPRDVLLTRGAEAAPPSPMIVSHKIRIPSSYPGCLPQHLIFQIEIDRTMNGNIKEGGGNVSHYNTTKPMDFRADDLAEIAAHLARVATSHLNNLNEDEDRNHMNEKEGSIDPKRTCPSTSPQLLPKDFQPLPDLANISSSKDSSVATELQYQENHKEVTKINDHLDVVKVDPFTSKVKETDSMETMLTYREWLVLHTAKERSSVSFSSAKRSPKANPL